MDSIFDSFIQICELNERESAALREILQDATVMELADVIARECFFPGGGTPPQFDNDEDMISKAWFGATFLSFESSRERYRQLGFPEEVWRESMTDLKIWLRYTERNYGVIGIWRNPRTWQMAIYRGEVTRHGRLECNTEYNYTRERLLDADGNSVLEHGDAVINIHIPEEGPMDMASCGKSIKRMADFFAKYRPDYKWEGVLCESWLLDRQLLPLLPKTSNIAKFQALGQHYIIEPTDATIWRIYGTKDPFAIENPTSLQRNMLNFIKDGGTFIEEGMFIPRRKIEAAGYELSRLL